MDWYQKVALVEMQTLNLKKSKTNSYLTFRQVHFKGLFGCSLLGKFFGLVDLFFFFNGYSFVLVVLLLLCFFVVGQV